MKKIKLLFGCCILLCIFSCNQQQKQQKQQKFYDSTTNITEYQNSYDANDKLTKIKITIREIVHLDNFRVSDKIIDTRWRHYQYENDTSYSYREISDTSGSIKLYRLTNRREESVLIDGKDTSYYDLICTDEEGKRISEKHIFRCSIPGEGNDINRNNETYYYYDKNGEQIKFYEHDFITEEYLETYTFDNLSYENACKRVSKSKNKQRIVCNYTEIVNDTIFKRTYIDNQISTTSKTWKTADKHIYIMFDCEGEWTSREEEYKQNGWDVNVCKYKDGTTNSIFYKNNQEIRYVSEDSYSTRIVESEYDTKGNIVKEIEISIYYKTYVTKDIEYF